MRINNSDQLHGYAYDLLCLGVFVLVADRHDSHWDRKCPHRGSLDEVSQVEDLGSSLWTIPCNTHTRYSKSIRLLEIKLLNIGSHRQVGLVPLRVPPPSPPPRLLPDLLAVAPRGVHAHTYGQTWDTPLPGRPAQIHFSACLLIFAAPPATSGLLMTGALSHDSTLHWSSELSPSSSGTRLFCEIKTSFISYGVHCWTLSGLV